MELNPNKLAASIAAAFAVLWVVCSLLVALFPGSSMAVTGHMFHANLSAMTWTLTWNGFFIGLAGWAILGGIAAWLVATAYNRMT